LLLQLLLPWEVLLMVQQLWQHRVHQAAAARALVLRVRQEGEVSEGLRDLPAAAV
jgi:hypothetical protein